VLQTALERPISGEGVSISAAGEGGCLGEGQRRPAAEGRASRGGGAGAAAALAPPCAP
jgi:hypothetical protein